MRLRNSTNIPSNLIRKLVRFARPHGIRRFKVCVKNTKRTYHGHGSSAGILIRINTKMEFPFRLWTYQYGQLKGRRYYIASLTEMLLYLIAHELMHTKQGQCGNCRGRVWGARGRYSEIETESYAIRKLREYRRLSR